MLSIFSKSVEKYYQEFFFRPISIENFSGTNQTILRKYIFILKKKKFDDKCSKNLVEFFFSQLIFFMGGGLRAPLWGCAPGL